MRGNRRTSGRRSDSRRPAAVAGVVIAAISAVVVRVGGVPGARQFAGADQTRGSCDGDPGAQRPGGGVGGGGGRRRRRRQRRVLPGARRRGRHPDVHGRQLVRPGGHQRADHRSAGGRPRRRHPVPGGPRHGQPAVRAYEGRRHVVGQLGAARRRPHRGAGTGRRTRRPGGRVRPGDRRQHPVQDLPARDGLVRRLYQPGRPGRHRAGRGRLRLRRDQGVRRADEPRDVRELAVRRRMERVEQARRASSTTPAAVWDPVRAQTLVFVRGTNLQLYRGSRTRDRMERLGVDGRPAGRCRGRRSTGRRPGRRGGAATDASLRTRTYRDGAWSPSYQLELDGRSASGPSGRPARRRLDPHPDQLEGRGADLRRAAPTPPVSRPSGRR